jgi:DNA polymerase I-like protein with 3'-5' exonuclease and polymerase domains
MIECPETEANYVAGLLKNQMESVAPELPVKLAVDVTTGKDWGAL